MLKYGLRAVLSPSSPVYVPPSANPDFLKFVTGFTRNSTMKAWKKAMGSLVPVNDLSLQSFDLLRDGGVAAETHEAKSFTAAYRTADERQTLLEEIEHIHASGGDITFDVLTGDEARSIEPALSDNIGAAIVLHGQRFINPGAYVSALADSVIDRGGKILTGAAITRISEAQRRRARHERLRRQRALRRRRRGDRRLARARWPASSASSASCRPAAATPSASPSTTCPTARSTSRPRASPARRSATGCASPA